MPHPRLDRNDLAISPLAERPNKVDIQRDHVSGTTGAPVLREEVERGVDQLVDRIHRARENGRPVILAFGAHTIKNGLGPILIELMEKEWITHLATNGAGIIHDWEFAYQGHSSEDVRTNVKEGRFGIWQETGFNINLALVSGAYEGLGYGEAVGRMIEKEKLVIPEREELRELIQNQLDSDPERAAAAADFSGVIQQFALTPGEYSIPHPFKGFSVQAAAHRLNIPFTGHPMIGHDIIYCHPMNHGGAVGRTALRDFLSFAHSVNQLNGGVYLSVGSAVMSPMIFEKSWSMARNLGFQEKREMDDLFITVVDLAESSWNWQRDGEPPETDPAYYLRYCKTFSRMGGEMQYLSCDNREFLPALLHRLQKT